MTNSMIEYIHKEKRNKKKGTNKMFEVCELCDVVVEKILVEEEGEYGCPICWEAYGEIH